jgi:hypothetical protein
MLHARQRYFVPSIRSGSMKRSATPSSKFLAITTLACFAFLAVGLSLRSPTDSFAQQVTVNNPATERLLLCGMDEVFETDAPTGDKINQTKHWSWRAKDHAEIPETIRSRFGTTDECKPVSGGLYLVTSSGGGCAAIDRTSNKVVWYAVVANAHSIEALPGNRVVVAGSVAKEGNRLVLFDLTVPEKQRWDGPLQSAHGVVWDDKRKRLWAIGYDVLECYSLQDWNSETPSLNRVASFPLPDAGGHDLQPIRESNDLVLSTHDHVYLFDRDQEKFRLHPEFGNERNVKCVSTSDSTGRVVWLKGKGDKWWTDTLGFVNPTSASVLPGEKLYKARWLTMATTNEADLSCEQPSPQAMAAAAGVTLPPSPWHVANIWWDFEKPVEKFESLEIDVTIDRDVPDDYNLYVSPCGIAKINGLQFYGGLQTNVNGWANKESRERVHPGKGAIFSRWSSDLKTPIGLDHVQTAAPECLVESAGYEGEFASVRRPYSWTRGTYTFCIVKREAAKVKELDGTWFECVVRDSAGIETSVGRIFFEGTDFTFWERHSAFVEVYSTSKIPSSGIPKVNVAFGWPRLNGEKVALNGASAYYPHRQGPASPDCAVVKANGEACVVEVGPIFKRDEQTRRHPLNIKLQAD